MLYFAVLVLLTVIAVHSYRHYILHRPGEPIEQLPFSGKIFRLGDVIVAQRTQPRQATRTVVCMPGFMETFAYFLEVYADEDVDLILVNNCYYHSPVEDAGAVQPSWIVANPHEPGTIQYDAFVLVQVLKRLPATPNVIVHGHSRGAAVVLEAGRLLQRMPDDEGVKYTALLEAPVLPNGKARGHDMALLARMAVRYFMPVAFHAYRHNALDYLDFGGYRHPHTPYKQHIVSRYFANPRQYRITLTNLRSIDEWVSNTESDIYDGYPNVAIMVPEKDIVLDRDVMFHCALQGGSRHVRVIEVDRTDHFISLERPDFVRIMVNRLHQENATPVKPPLTLVS